MFVLCPHCQFLVASDPASQRPPATCPRCREPLQPTAEAAPAPAPEPAPLCEPRPQADTGIAADADETSIARAERVDIVDDAIDPADASPAAAIAANAPQFVQRLQVQSVRGMRSGGRLWWAVAGLCLLLVLQLLLADRARLARDPQWRPVLLQLCGVLSCSLPPWHEPAAFTVLDRDVRPAAPGVLHVTATFRNDARWPQAWPSLLLTLSDVDGRNTGARVFTPREYLGAAPDRPWLDSGQSARVKMDVIEPGRRVVAFTFDFR